MAHYICRGGCKGESSKPGACQAIGCPKEGQTLEQCDCTDGKHEKPQDAASQPETV